MALGAVVAIAGAVFVWHVVQEARWRSYVINDLPAYRSSHFSDMNASTFDYEAVPIQGSERPSRDPVMFKPTTFVQYGAVPGPNTQVKLDEFNARLAKDPKDKGQLFSRHALGGSSDDYFDIEVFFGRDRATIARYAAKLNALDGVNHKLTLAELAGDPTLAGLADLYTSR